jgi:hypothetical protein
VSTVVQTYDLGSVTSLMTTELNSLASSSGLTAGAISSVGGTSGAFNNVLAGGGLGGFMQGLFELKLAAPAGTLTAGTAAYIWFLGQVDGTNYEDGGSSVIPARRADLIIPVRNVSTAQRITAVAPLPPNIWFVLVAQNTGQTWASSANTLKVVPITSQIG